MGPDKDKLFLEVAGLPVVAHTWRRFDHAKEISDIVMVVRDGLQSAFHDLAAQTGVTKPFRVVAGGAAFLVLNLVALAAPASPVADAAMRGAAIAGAASPARQRPVAKAQAGNPPDIRGCLRWIR